VSVVLSSTPSGVPLPSKKAWTAVDQLISSISTLVLIRQGSFLRYHYFLDVLVLVLSNLCGITFIAGPQVQPTRSPFVANFSRCLPFLLFFFLPQSASVFIPGRRSRRHQLLKTARLFVYFHFPVSIGSNVSSTTHRMLSHLALVLSHSWTSYKLERRSPKLYKRATTVG